MAWLVEKLNERIDVSWYLVRLDPGYATLTPQSHKAKNFETEEDAEAAAAKARKTESGQIIVREITEADRRVTCG